MTVQAQGVGSDTLSHALFPSDGAVACNAHCFTAVSVLFASPVGISVQGANDSTHVRATRSSHVKTGALTGAAIGGVAGAVVGIVAGQASDPHWQVHDAGVILGIEGALVGAIVGGIVGLSLPHS